ncbi:MAG TPA: hypothetical protein VIJ21_08195 [Solirubrobacterales bacterium]
MTRLSQAFLPTLKDAPADAEAISHKLMVRAGLIRRMGAGLWKETGRYGIDDLFKLEDRKGSPPILAELVGSLALRLVGGQRGRPDDPCRADPVAADQDRVLGAVLVEEGRPERPIEEAAARAHSLLQGLGDD